VKKSSSASSSLLELIMIVAVALGLALGIQAFLVKPYRIPSPSMVPTLVEGQRILVNRIGNRFGDPEIGDVVVFRPPAGAEDGPRCGADRPPEQVCPEPTEERAEETYVKRVVAGPGDRIEIAANGRRQEEAFARECEATCELSAEFTVPADHYFMMGDNRGGSSDSREWGPVPRDWIIGGAFATYWPPKRIGLL
jgi:signal peptidase I